MLDHDFAFSDREGVIERFVLDLELAPEWTARERRIHRELTDLLPGVGANSFLELRHEQSRKLAGVLYPIDRWWRHGALAVVIVGIVVMLRSFLRRESDLGSLEPAAAPADFDPDWLDEHVFAWPPEVAGALWDESVGAPEVAALIARWVAEGKVESEVVETSGLFGRDVLRLTRLIERGARHLETTLSWGIFTFASWLVIFPVGFALARRWRDRVDGLRPRVLFMVVPALALAFAYWWLPGLLGAFVSFEPRIRGTAALGLFTLGTCSFFLNQASTRAPLSRVRQRQRLAVARRRVRAELSRPDPRLKDAHVPHLIALELQRDVDRWSRAFGGQRSGSSTPNTTTWSGSGSATGGAGGGGFAGGGGAFGGAGATGAWAAAAASIAGGVTAAGSRGGSSGGASSGGGGGSSGGGGGGGW